MNTFRKDGTANWNTALGRSFRLPGGERSLDFRPEIINFFNTPQFDKPGGATGIGHVREDYQYGQQGPAGADDAEAEFLTRLSHWPLGC